MTGSKNHVVLLVLFMLIACSEWDLDRTGFTEIITVGASEIQFSSAILLGDIEGLRNATVVERGFVISSVANDVNNLQFDQPGVVKIEATDRDPITEGRAFIARATGLSASTEYFFRTYVFLADNEQPAYGNIEQFISGTLSLSIESVTRASSSCSTTASVGIFIPGYDALVGVELGLVYSNDFTNLLPTINQGIYIPGGDLGTDGKINIEIQVECDRTYVVRAVVVGTTSENQYSEPYSFTMKEQGYWKKATSFSGSSKEGPIMTSIGYDLLLGSGHRGTNLFKSYYNYNLLTDTWQELGNFDSLETTHGLGFTLGGTGYAMNGRVDFSKCNLDDECGCSTAHCSITPYASCIIPGCSESSLSRFIYCDCYDNRLFRYDQALNEWIVIGKFPGVNRKSPVVMKTAEKALIGLGVNQLSQSQPAVTSCSQCTESIFPKDMWEYDPKLNSWKESDPFPGSGRMEAIAFWISDKGYVGLGETFMAMGQNAIREIRVSHFVDLYSYNPQRPSGSKWTRVADLPVERKNVIALSSLGGYVLVNNDNPSELNLWKFDPTDGVMGSWQQLDIPPEVNGIPSGASSSGNISFVYLTNTSDNFWIYVPEID